MRAFAIAGVFLWTACVGSAVAPEQEESSSNGNASDPAVVIPVGTPPGSETGKPSEPPKGEPSSTDAGVTPSMPEQPPQAEPPTGAKMLKRLSTRGDWPGIQAITGGAPAFRDVTTDVKLPPGTTSAIRVEVRDGWHRYSGDTNEGSEGQDDERSGVVWTSWWQMFAPDYPTNGLDWQIFLQWHGGSGSPPVSMTADGNEVALRVGGPTTTSGNYTWLYPWRGSMDRGVWHHYQLGVNFTTDRSKAWVELWRDGKQVLARKTNVTTSYEGSCYLKQGMYRNASFSGTAVTYFAGEALWDARPAYPGPVAP